MPRNPAVLRGYRRRLSTSLGTLRKTVEDPAISTKMYGWGITPDYVAGPEQAEINAREIEIWKRIAKDANIKSEQ